MCVQVYVFWNFVQSCMYTIIMGDFKFSSSNTRLTLHLHAYMATDITANIRSITYITVLCWSQPLSLLPWLSLHAHACTLV